MGDLRHADHAAAAGPVVDDEWLAEPLLELLPDDPRDQAGRAAGRERHDEGNRTAWILAGAFLGLGDRGQQTTHYGCNQNGLHLQLPRMSGLRNITLTQRNPDEIRLSRVERCSATCVIARRHRGMKQRPAMRMYSPEELDVMAEAFDRALEKAPNEICSTAATQRLVQEIAWAVANGIRDEDLLANATRSFERTQSVDGSIRPGTRTIGNCMRLRLETRGDKRAAARRAIEWKARNRASLPLIRMAPGDRAHKCWRDVAGPYRPCVLHALPLPNGQWFACAIIGKDAAEEQHINATAGREPRTAAPMTPNWPRTHTMAQNNA